MPIYEYQCAACGQIVEKWQKFSDAPLAICPNCGGSLTKLISNCAFHLKGGGWYVTDYGGSRQAASGEEKPAEASPTSETSSDTQASPTSEPSDTSAPPKIK